MPILRWLLVLPAALLAQSAVQLVGGSVIAAVAKSLGSRVQDAPVASWSHLLISYVLAALAFVVAGAKTAPQRRPATGCVLMVLGIGLSLLKHVIGQHLAGNRVGGTNYLHAGLEIAGYVAGAAVIVLTSSPRSSASRS
jgi:hypothetical protein